MATRDLVAIDLGASSGRLELLRFDGARLSLDEVHRFPNTPVRAAGTLYWDALRLWSEVTRGLALARSRSGSGATSVAVDGWGVDFALLDARGDLLGNTVSYRDSRTQGMMARAFARVPREDVFAATGAQFMPLNTLYQLLALQAQGSPLLAAADRLVMLPDLFAYWLSGAKTSEYTVATTTQCYDVSAGDWSRGLLERLDLPTGLLPEVVPPGTRLGRVRADVAEATGLDGALVVAPASHDTASAVAAVPAVGTDFAFISLGTWSLVGAEIPKPRMDAAALAANFTNEGGIGGTIRCLKNVAGLWLIEECRRAWERQGSAISHPELAALAERARPLRSLIDVDHPSLTLPDDMPTAIAAECVRTGQPAPEDRGAMARCALESLAVKYRLVLERLRALVDQPISRLHVVGGGSRNRLLCQMTADATGLPVYAGPAEATAVGNGLAQLIALGDLGTVAEGRELVSRSFEIAVFEPRDAALWDEAASRFRRLYPEL